MDSETGWTGELWLKVNLLNWQNYENSIFLISAKRKNIYIFLIPDLRTQLLIFFGGVGVFIDFSSFFSPFFKFVKFSCFFCCFFCELFWILKIFWFFFKDLVWTFLIIFKVTKVTTKSYQGYY